MSNQPNPFTSMKTFNSSSRLSKSRIKPDYKISFLSADQAGEPSEGSLSKSNSMPLALKDVIYT